eukprot:5461394-Prymnesium_polylepis.1
MTGFAATRVGLAIIRGGCELGAETPDHMIWTSLSLQTTDTNKSFMVNAFPKHPETCHSSKVHPSSACAK